MLLMSALFHMNMNWMQTRVVARTNLTDRCVTLRVFMTLYEHHNYTICAVYLRCSDHRDKNNVLRLISTGIIIKNVLFFITTLQ